jgi:hypothetical protein
VTISLPGAVEIPYSSGYVPMSFKQFTFAPIGVNNVLPPLYDLCLWAQLDQDVWRIDPGNSGADSLETDSLCSKN